MVVIEIIHFLRTSYAQILERIQNDKKKQCPVLSGLDDCYCVLVCSLARSYEKALDLECGCPWLNPRDRSIRLVCTPSAWVHSHNLNSFYLCLCQTHTHTRTHSLSWPECFILGNVSHFCWRIPYLVTHDCEPFKHSQELRNEGRQEFVYHLCVFERIKYLANRATPKTDGDRQGPVWCSYEQRVNYWSVYKLD